MSFRTFFWGLLTADRATRPAGPGQMAADHAVFAKALAEYYG